MPPRVQHPPTGDIITCPRCARPGVELVAGRLARHVLPTAPSRRCPASGLLPADVA